MMGVALRILDFSLEQKVGALLGDRICHDLKSAVLLITDNRDYPVQAEQIPAILLAEDEFHFCDLSRFDEILPVGWVDLLPQRVDRYIDRARFDRSPRSEPGLAEESCSRPGNANLPMTDLRADFFNVIPSLREIVYRLWIHPRIRFSYISHRIEDLTGISSDAILSDVRLFLRMLDPADLTYLLRGVRNRSFFKHPFLFRMKGRNGQLWMESIVQPVFDDSGRIVCVDGIFRDVSGELRYEQQLLEESERFRVLLETLNQGVMITDRKGRPGFLNRAMQKLTGYSLSEMNHGEFFDRLFLTEQGAEDARRRLRDLADHRFVPGALTTIRTKGGESRTVAVAASVIRGFGGPRIVSVFTDVTEDQLQKDLLRSRWNQIQLLMRHLPVILWEVDAEGCLTFLEGSLLEKMKISPRRFLNRNVGRLFALENEWEEIRKQVYAGLNETIVRTIREVTMRIHIRPVWDPEGHVIGMTGLCTDISDMFVAMELVQKHKSFFESLIDQLPVGVYVLDPDHQFSGTLVNRCAAGLLGLDAGRPSRNSYPLQEDTDRLDDLLESGSGKIVIERLQRIEGDPQYLKIMMMPVRAGQKASMILGVVEDVSDQKIYEEQIMRAREEAEKANEHKSRFLAQMSHEIRTPLNAILGFSEILLNRLGPHSIHRDFLKGIQANGESLFLLLNDILDFSKIEAGKYDLRPVDVDVLSLMSDIHAMFAGKAREKKIEFETWTDPGVPGCVIIDDLRLRQILINLVGNAIKYTLSGNVRVDLTGTPQPAADTVSLVFSVRDTGIGIPAGQIEKIFEPFQQGDHYREGGSGLGLAIASRLARILGGFIDVQSTQGAGSVFRLHLPDVKVGRQAGSGQPHLDNLARMRFNGECVLIVEDDFSNRKVLGAFLDGLGLEIQEAANGEEALSRIQKRRPDLILMDLHMPGMDGYELSKRIRAEATREDLPIVGLSGSQTEDDRPFIEELMNGFLQKPFSRSDLLIAVANFLPCTEADPVEQQQEEIVDDDTMLPEDIGIELLQRDDLAELLRRSEEARSSLNLNEIRDLSIVLHATGERGQSLHLQRFADRLGGAVELVSIGRIIQLLDHFKSLAGERLNSSQFDSDDSRQNPGRMPDELPQDSSC